MLPEEIKKAVEIFVIDVLKDEETKRSPEIIQALVELIRVIDVVCFDLPNK